MVVLGLGIAKHHGEQGEPAFDEIFEEAPPLGQIERVILVDDGGNEEDRTMPDLLCLGSILDEFEHLVSHHDVAGRHREIVANLERAEVHLRWNRPAFDGILASAALPDAQV